VIEAELKARLNDPAAVRAALDQRADAEKATYRDVYYDTAAGELDRDGREIRLRTVETGHSVRHLLTFKEPAVEEASRSKPEHESTVATPAAIAQMLGSLGLKPAVELTKECENFRFDGPDGREFLATVVRVPEIEGTFLEVETMAAENQVSDAIAAVRDVLHQLGVSDEELTSELYTDAVRNVRSSNR
jgi:adenylate cyclase class 2